VCDILKNPGDSLHKVWINATLVSKNLDRGVYFGVSDAKYGSHPHCKSPFQSTVFRGAASMLVSSY